MKGIYALAINLSRDSRVKVGSLGEISFRKGTYVYVGSAQSNLEQRVKRHLRREKRIFWHIDYLLNDNAVRIVEVLIGEGKKDDECVLASNLGERGEPIAGFGCSDCRCPSHLIRIDNFQFLHERMKIFSVQNS